MSDLVIKICGVRTPEAGLTARSAGADLIGLIFAPSKRTVTTEEAAEIVRVVRYEEDPSIPQDDKVRRDDNVSRLELGSRDGRSSGPPPAAVGVFVDEPAERLVEIGEQVDLDFIQLSGDEPPEIIGEIGRPVIKALRLPSGFGYDAACREAERYLDAPIPACALLLDAHVAGSYGGNGVVGDWDLAARLVERYPIILAGGLDPENVSAALGVVNSLGVDVSSGVETNGAKDHDKIRQFISEARAARVERDDRTDSIREAFRLHIRYTV